MSGTRRPSLFHDLRSGAAGPAVRVMVTLAAAMLLAGLAAAGSFILSALWVPSNVSYGSRVYVRVDDTVAAVCFALASLAYLPIIIWIWARIVIRSAAFWFAAAMTFGIGLAVLGVCVAVEELVGGNTELMHMGVFFIGSAVTMLTWVQTWRRFARGRPRYDKHGEINLQCPACGYSMVGLTEPRCPECGAAYTLDDLIRRQDFDDLRPRPPRLPDAEPPIARIATGTDD